ncbi:MAG: hypothetical protein EXQ63_02640 [Ilumatobacteraceae bacterium]|nr:hypothetical protein [Ilumatobacteraceae bacterium]
MLERTVLLAHQGGWDEMLYVLGPILIIVGLLRIANTRAKKLGSPNSHDDAASGTGSNPHD